MNPIDRFWGTGMSGYETYYPHRMSGPIDARFEIRPAEETHLDDVVRLIEIADASRASP